MLENITPVLLTFNEAPNIRRTLEGLTWARDIVVVDSYSADDTLQIVRRFPQTRIYERKFSSHADQWNFAAFETNIKTDWILALDADYLLSPSFVDELSALDPPDSVNGYRAAFKYCIRGKPLRGGLYPPAIVLFRRLKGRYEQDGHTQRLRIEGAIGRLEEPLLHDDRKTLSHWLSAQDRYMRLESEYILRRKWSELNFGDKLRRFPPLAPLAIFVHCYFFKFGILDGRAGLYYALQRLLAEALLALRIIESKF
ncbi:MAG: glycosyltransferase family 2 protein [Methylocystis sp.]|nr:glycosyltransferase family 2 protein [Methylocystis sp.]